MQQVMRLKEVISATGLSKSHIYRLIRSGRFPEQFKLCGARASGFLRDEINEWINKQAAERGEKS